MSVSIDDIIKQYPRLSMYKNNPTLILTLYRQLHPPTLKEMTVGSKVDKRKFLVVEETSSRTYYGCPSCFRKLNADPNVIVTCDNCNKQVEVAPLTFREYLAGDETGICILSFSPRIKVDNPVGKILEVIGRATAMREFKVGDVTTSYPLIVVSSFSVVEEVLTNTPSITSFSSSSVQTLTPSQQVSVSATPNAENAELDKKIKKLKAWLAIMQYVTDDALKSYAEDVLQLDEKYYKDIIVQEEDGQGNVFYRLKRPNE